MGDESGDGDSDERGATARARVAADAAVAAAAPSTPAAAAFLEDAPPPTFPPLREEDAAGGNLRASFNPVFAAGVLAVLVAVLVVMGVEAEEVSRVGAGVASPLLGARSGSGNSGSLDQGAPPIEPAAATATADVVVVVFLVFFFRFSLGLPGSPSFLGRFLLTTAHRRGA